MSSYSPCFAATEAVFSSFIQCGCIWTLKGGVWFDICLFGVVSTMYTRSNLLAATIPASIPFSGTSASLIQLARSKTHMQGKTSRNDHSSHQQRSETTSGADPSEATGRIRAVRVVGLSSRRSGDDPVAASRWPFTSQKYLGRDPANLACPFDSCAMMAFFPFPLPLEKNLGGLVPSRIRNGECGTALSLARPALRSTFRMAFLVGHHA